MTTQQMADRKAWKRIFRGSLVVLIAMLVIAERVSAGPCTAGIDTLQANLDVRIEEEAARGRSVRESTGATTHHQPTPGSILQAEQSIGEGAPLTAAMTALHRAREADSAGNVIKCEEALATARSALQRSHR
jgi:hypothetical protein